MPDTTPRQSHKPLIAAILPVYNEENNVSGVLDVLHASSILDEIILVDDGSSDQNIRNPETGCGTRPAHPGNPP